MTNINPQESPIIIREKLWIDCPGRKLKNLDTERETDLLPLASNLLAYLLINNGMNCTIGMISKELWADNENEYGASAIQNHIKNIRKSIKTIECDDVLKIKNKPCSRGSLDDGTYGINIYQDDWRYESDIPKNESNLPDTTSSAIPQDFIGGISAALGIFAERSSQLFQYNKVEGGATFINNQTINNQVVEKQNVENQHVENQTVNNQYVAQTHPFEAPLNISHDYYNLILIENNKSDIPYNFSIRSELSISEKYGTNSDIVERLCSLSDEAKRDIYTFPTLFSSISDGEVHNYYIAFIKTVSVIHDRLHLTISLYNRTIPPDIINAHKKELHIIEKARCNELLNEHWAVKPADLLSVLGITL